MLYIHDSSGTWPHFFSFSSTDIRVQLNEQLKCLDNRLEVQQGIVNEFQDIFRRKAEIESNYSKELENLYKAINKRHKESKQKYVVLDSTLKLKLDGIHFFSAS